MFRTSFMLRPLAAAALLAVAGASQAAITVYTTLGSFTAATASPGTDGFEDLSNTRTYDGPLTRSAGAYGYSVTTAPSATFFPGGSLSDIWLSTNNFSDTIVFSGFGSTVRGVGGLFFGSDVDGQFASGSVTVSATDASGTVTETIVDPGTSSFLGFVSTGALTSVVVASVPPATGFLWPTVNNLVLASAVPEPETYALMLAGLGLLGFMARRRGR